MPTNKSFTPRFGRPLKLPKHSVSMFFLDDILPENIKWKDQATDTGKPAFIAKYHAKRDSDGKRGFCYVIRAVTMRIRPIPPP